MSKRYVLVGGTYGVGKALVKSLLDGGNNVTVLSRSDDTLAGAEHLEYDAFNGDFPSIDGEVHGFAYMPGTINLKPFNRMTENDFLTDFEKNVVAATTAIRQILPNLRSAENSSIVLFSTVAVQTGMGFHTSVAAAKGAIEGLTRALAAELAPKIRVNCVAPSLTDTPLADKLLNSDDKRKAAAERHPLKRFGTPEDIASAAEFLLTDKSSWITGQVLQVDGGIGTLR